MLFRSVSQSRYIANLLTISSPYNKIVHTWLPVIIAKILSILQASSLRDRYYTAQQRIEILETALEDIERISKSRVDVSERHRLITGIISNTKKL